MSVEIYSTRISPQLVN